jgi:hypothetical protein
VKIVGMGRPEEQDQNPSDVRALTRHERTLALRHALAEGEASGPAFPFDFDAFIAARKAP